MAIQVGLSLDEFWRLSTVEFRVYVSAWAERQKAELKRDVALAWHIAALVTSALFGADGLKPLWEVLGEPPPKKTAAQEKAELQVFAATWGLKMRPANKKIKVVYPKGHPRHAAQALH